jgi:hypothetical protein
LIKMGAESSATRAVRVDSATSSDPAAVDNAAALTETGAGVTTLLLLHAVRKATDTAMASRRFMFGLFRPDKRSLIQNGYRYRYTGGEVQQQKPTRPHKFPHNRQQKGVTHAGLDKP